jgi:protoporphyrinogen oxidase
LKFKNGCSASFDKLVSSIPLDRLIPLIAGAPKDVLEAASLLACSQCAVVNIGINRPAGVRPQWSYFYDEDICFARVSYRDNFSPRVVPAGCGGFQAETYFSTKYKPMTETVEDWIEPTIDGLLKCGLVRDRSEIIHKSAIWAPYANIIFDHDRPRSVEIVHGFLNDIGIARCGRYGDWGYIWTHQAFMSGERAAKGVQRADFGCAT